tara:strand:- start:2684 stop:2947 length:264 start_codon:yes stop_codon:yes gene_type:complete
MYQENASTYEITTRFYDGEFFRVHANFDWQRTIGQAGALPCELVAVQIDKILDDNDNLRHDLEDHFQAEMLENWPNSISEPLDRQFA